MTKKWVRAVETGEKYAVTDDSILLMGIDRNGNTWVGRMGIDTVHVITTHRSPDGTGHILSPATDDEKSLVEIEKICREALSIGYCPGKL